MGMNQSDQRCKACHAETTTADESGLCAPCRIVRDGLRENIAQSDQPAQECCCGSHKKYTKADICPDCCIHGTNRKRQEADPAATQSELLGAQKHLETCAACNHGRTPCGEYILNYAPVAAPQSDKKPTQYVQDRRLVSDDEILGLTPASQSDQPAQAFRELLRRLVDETWSVATESNTVPSTEWADRIISRIPELATPASQPVAPAQKYTRHTTDCTYWTKNVCNCATPSSGADARGLAERIYKECVYRDGVVSPPSEWAFATDQCAALLESFRAATYAEGHAAAVKMLGENGFAQRIRAETLEQAEDVAEEVWSRGVPGTEWDTASVAIMSGIRNLKSDPNWLARQLDEASSEALEQAAQHIRSRAEAHRTSIQADKGERFNKGMADICDSLDMIAEQIRTLHSDPNWLARQIVAAKVEEVNTMPHENDCSRYKLSGNIVNPPCDCWVSQRIAALESERAKLGGGK